MALVENKPVDAVGYCGQTGKAGPSPLSAIVTSTRVLIRYGLLVLPILQILWNS